MPEPVYDGDDSGIIGRVISLTLAGFLIWFFLNSGTLRSGRLVVVPLVPLAMIWFPDTIAGYLGDGFTPTLLSRVAWFVLVTLMILPILVWLV